MAVIRKGDYELPICRFTEEEQRQELKSALKKLTYREREMVKLRYGLSDGYTYTYREISHIFKCSTERCRQIISKATKKLKPLLEQPK